MGLAKKTSAGSMGATGGAQLAIRGTRAQAEADAGAGGRNDTLPEAETEMAARGRGAAAARLAIGSAAIDQASSR